VFTSSRKRFCFSFSFSWLEGTNTLAVYVYDLSDPNDTWTIFPISLIAFPLLGTLITSFSFSFMLIMDGVGYRITFRLLIKKNVILDALIFHALLYVF
jgi:hypothetical protein